MELYWTLLAWKELNLRIWEISQACLKTYSTEDGMWNHYTTTKSSISLGGCFISRKTTSQVPKSTCPCQTANHQLSLSLWAIQMANVSMFQRLYLIFQTRWFSSTTARITNKYLRALSMPIEKHHIRTQIPWTPKPFLEEYCIYANSGIKKSQAFQNIKIYIYIHISAQKSCPVLGYSISSKSYNQLSKWWLPCIPRHFPETPGKRPGTRSESPTWKALKGWWKWWSA